MESTRARGGLAALHALLLAVGVSVVIQQPAATAQTGGVVNWVGPEISGSWFDAARSGEGIIVQFLADGGVIAVWFTYPAQGEVGEQAWLLAQNGVVNGNTIQFANVLRPQGGVFGDTFDPGQIVRAPWGTLSLQFHSCRSVTVQYVGPAAFGSGTRQMTRLTEPDQLGCDGLRELTALGARAMSGLRARSGAWFVPSRSGEGWLVEDLPNQLTLVTWFTFDPQGRQAWTVGVGSRQGSRVVINDNVITRGTRFGSAFDPGAVQRLPWGRLELDFGNCDAAQVTYTSTLPGYAGAARSSVRLTTLAGAPCIDATPAAPTAARWTERTATPASPQSELAVTALDGMLYAIGGAGDARGFKRYDAATNSWTRLTDTPAGRDHLSAFAIDGGVFMVGGASRGGGEQSINGFRYDVAAARWDNRAELPAVFGSHAAVTNGRAFIGSEAGTLHEYDPRSRAVRVIEPASTQARDHSQVVAFLGEIWMIGGRSPETNSVSIYDPVSRRWRAGPPMVNIRGGFAAAVVGHRIVVAGGEVFSNGTRLEPRTEVFTAGDNVWRLAPNLPVPVHGVAAGSAQGRYFLVSGSTVAGSFAGATGRVFEFIAD